MLRGNSIGISSLIGAIWGFAEATLFFLVPDIWISLAALKSGKRALAICLAAAVGATLGGLLLFHLAKIDPNQIENLVLTVPGISPTTFETVRYLISANGMFFGMLEGAFSGIPYKVFVLDTAAAEAPASTLAVFTPAARLPRFLLVALAVWLIGRWVGNRLKPKGKARVCLALWLIFYSFYFYAFGI